LKKRGKIPTGEVMPGTFLKVTAEGRVVTERHEGIDGDKRLLHPLE